MARRWSPYGPQTALRLLADGFETASARLDDLTCRGQMAQVACSLRFSLTSRRQLDSGGFCGVFVAVKMLSWAHLGSTLGGKMSIFHGRGCIFSQVNFLVQKHQESPKGAPGRPKRCPTETQKEPKTALRSLQDGPETAPKQPESRPGKVEIALRNKFVFTTLRTRPRIITQKCSRHPHRPPHGPTRVAQEGPKTAQKSPQEERQESP